MCLFLTLVIPKKHSLSLFTPLLEEHQLTLTRKEEDLGLQKLEITGLSYDAASSFRSMCDCDTVLGAKARKSKRKNRNESIDQKEAQLWLSFLQKSLALKEVYRLGLLISQSKTPVKRKEKVPLSALSESFLLQLETNVLYDFYKE